MRSNIGTFGLDPAGWLAGFPGAGASEKPARYLFFSTAVVLGLCLIFGGATHAGTLPDALLQIAAVPLIVMAAHGLAAGPHAWRLALLAGLALAIVPLLQLVPLPPFIWTALPRRDLIVEALALSGEPLAWRPLSLTPHQTWLAFASLIPPLAVFFAAVQLNAEARRALAAAVVVWAVAASLIGLLQVALQQGAEASVPAFDNDGEATGFFANRNHFAASLYCALLFAACFLIDRLRALASSPQMMHASRQFMMALLVSLGVLILLAGEITARSRAGIALTMVALLAIAFMAAAEERHRSRGAGRVFALAAGMILVCAAQFAMYRLFQRFEADPFQDARLVIARNTWDAALAHFPWGSGLGSFVPVYQTFETAVDALVDRYANRAHNDGLELLLEAGVAGLAGMLLFAAWISTAVRGIWRRDGRAAKAALPIDGMLMRAASLAILLLVVHSLVDYPLRTTAMASLFALCCAFLIPAPAPRTQTSERAPPRPPRGLADERLDPDSSSPAPFVPWRQAAQAAPAGPPPDAIRPPASDLPPSEPSTRWGGDIQWPEAWNETAGDRAPANDPPRSGPNRPRRA